MCNEVLKGNAAGTGPRTRLVCMNRANAGTVATTEAELTLNHFSNKRERKDANKQ